MPGWLRGLWKTFKRFPTRGQISIGLVGVLVLAAIGFGAYQAYGALFPGTCASSGSTYLVPSGQTGDCVGYTDGGYVFDESLKSVEQDIQRENQWVAAQHSSDYVSVVILLPISADDGTIMAMTTVLNHLRGAYTAQHYANHGGDVDGKQPYIRLLIGNAGYQANQWARATSIITSRAADQHIVAVTGLGVSLATTLDAARALTRAGIPVVGSSNSADEFDDIPNMIRVTPSNKDEISVAIADARRFPRAILIKDDNSGDITDSDLGTDFQSFEDATHKIIDKEVYDTSYRDRQQSTQAEKQGDEVVRNTISQMVSNICTAEQAPQLAVVLFAGRGRDLAELVGDLAGRPCLDKPVTIVASDDVVNMPSSQAVDNGLKSGVTVDYPALADQNEWAQGTGPKTLFSIGKQGFTTTFKPAFQQLFPGVPLTDENLFVSYDATLTAISAIRLAGADPLPTTDAVAAELPALHGAHTVYGASGPLAFNADWQDPHGSNPENKPIPLLRYTPNGPQFLKLYWPPYS